MTTEMDRLGETMNRAGLEQISYGTKDLHPDVANLVGRHLTEAMAGQAVGVNKGVGGRF